MRPCTLSSPACRWVKAKWTWELRVAGVLDPAGAPQGAVAQAPSSGHGSGQPGQHTAEAPLGSSATGSSTGPSNGSAAAGSAHFVGNARPGAAFGNPLLTQQRNMRWTTGGTGPGHTPGMGLGSEQQQQQWSMPHLQRAPAAQGRGKAGNSGISNGAGDAEPPATQASSASADSA